LRYGTDIELKSPAPQEKLWQKRQTADGCEEWQRGGCERMAAWIMTGLRGAVFALATAGAMATGAVAQESTNRVATKTDWSVFTEENPKECWGVSSPKESVNTRDGAPASVRRGDILLFVTFRPGSGAAGEVSFTGGYPFAPGSTVNMTIDSSSFEMFVDGEWAWPANSADDAAMLAALKAGSSAVLTARSARGTQTKDTFSLLGFTAAMDESEARCK
jgi:hypothetical protein